MRALLLLLAASRTLGSPLKEAIDANDPTGVRTALASGADVNEVVGDGGQTAIMLAVQSDKLRAAAALMKMGADATIPDSSGMTPMTIAAMKGFGKIIRMLLRYKVDATTVDPSSGLSPFHHAVRGTEAGHTDAVFAFLDGGVPPDLRTADFLGHELPLYMSGNANTRKLLTEAIHEQRRSR